MLLLLIKGSDSTLGEASHNLPQMLAADLASETHSLSLKEQKRETLCFSYKILIRFLNIRHCIGAGDKQSALRFHSRQKDKRWEISRSMGMQDGEYDTGYHTGGNTKINIQDTKKRDGQVSQKTRGCFSCVAKEVAKEVDRCK